MSLENIKKLRAERGFTIVELLIVIVVIGILVTIVVVAYNGVQNQARATKARTNASSIQKRAEAYNADAGNGAYPAGAAAWGVYTTANPDAPGAVPAGITVQEAALGAGEAVRYLDCTDGGYRITYWDYSANPAAESSGSKVIHGGGSDASSTCPTP